MGLGPHEPHKIMSTLACLSCTSDFFFGGGVGVDSSRLPHRFSVVESHYCKG